VTVCITTGCGHSSASKLKLKANQKTREHVPKNRLLQVVVMMTHAALDAQE